VQNITAHSTQQVVKAPQVVYKPRMLVVSSDCAGYFLIESVYLGKNPIFAAAGAVPARCFTELAQGMSFRDVTVQVSQQLVVTVTNLEASDKVFQAVMTGDSVE
jgi:hypothetical protein